MKGRLVVTIGLAVAVSGLVAPAHARGNKRLPKAASMVESIRGTSKVGHFVRSEGKGASPAPSGVLREAPPNGASHAIREMPESR
jgi:hypothetical protein